MQVWASNKKTHEFSYSAGCQGPHAAKGGLALEGNYVNLGNRLATVCIGVPAVLWTPKAVAIAYGGVNLTN